MILHSIEKKLTSDEEVVTSIYLISAFKIAKKFAIVNKH
ncbi:hypothetical protein J694_0399 [Acinetobacter sp. 1281984]|nr:hypothetical protein J627_2093 [Acinetobacter sp. 1245593]EXR31206.1 hypothetical protein J694_0399 [Acinetobacter sp. 1281984]